MAGRQADTGPYHSHLQLVGWLENVGSRGGDRKKQSDVSRGGDSKNRAM